MAVRYWWVSQNQTYTHEVGGGYMWAPKTNKRGGNLTSYDNMTEINAGDLIFSFALHLGQPIQRKSLGFLKKLARPGMMTAGRLTLFMNQLSIRSCQANTCRSWRHCCQ